MEAVVANLTGSIRRESRNGRNYVVAPMTLIVPGVLNGSDGPLYYPPEEILKNPTDWNGVPLVVYHPIRNGVPTSARDPDIAEKQEIGRVYHAAIDDDGKLKAEGWFELDAVKRVDSRILSALEKGLPIELSTGLSVDKVPGEGTHNGKNYTYIARNYRPDHLAILPDQKGACSVKDGCGVLVNAKNAVAKFWDWLTGNCGGGGNCALTDEDHRLGDDAKKQADAGENPASWVADEDKWEQAKAAADKGGYGDDKYWAVVSHIYRQMGGETKEVNNMDREKVIQYLVANCDCWKDGQKILNGLDDQRLTALVERVKKHKADEVIANSARKGFKVGGKSFVFNAEADEFELVKEEEEEEEEGEKKEKTENERDEKGHGWDEGEEFDERKAAFHRMAGNKAKKQTANQWLASAPAEIQSAVRNAMAIEHRERQFLVEKIVANAGDNKERVAKRLLNKPLDELQDLASLINPKQQAAEPFSFFGAAAPVVANQSRIDPDDVLALPVINWKKEGA